MAFSVEFTDIFITTRESENQLPMTCRTGEGNHRQSCSRNGPTHAGTVIKIFELEMNNPTWNGKVKDCQSCARVDISFYNLIDRGSIVLGSRIFKIDLDCV